MKVAILGGTRFVGPFIVRALIREGHEVAVYHRGKMACEFPCGHADAVKIANPTGGFDPPPTDSIVLRESRRPRRPHQNDGSLGLLGRLKDIIVNP